MNKLINNEIVVSSEKESKIQPKDIGKSNEGSSFKNDCKLKENYEKVITNSDTDKSNQNEIKEEVKYLSSENGPLIKIENMSNVSNVELNNLLTQVRDLLAKYEGQIKIQNEKITMQEDKIKKQNDKLKEHENIIIQHNNRITKLEQNEQLLFHLISMYNSRDIFKSIFTIFYDSLDLKQVQTCTFDKLKSIISFLEKEEGKTSQKMKNEKIPKKLKITIAKYLKLHFFINKVNNKIIHRNFSKEEKEILSKLKEKEVMPLIPDMDFEQCFQSLIFYVENYYKNSQYQEAMKNMYIEKYINDDGLGPVKDSKKQVLKLDNDGVKILLSVDDIEEVKKYFEKIQIGNSSFPEECNSKIWDKENENY